MNFQTILLFVTIIANLFLGSVILARAYTRKYAWYFLGIVVSISLWALGDILLLNSTEKFADGIGAVLFYLAPLFTPLFVWFFSYSFPDDSHIPKKSYYFGIISIAFWSLLITLNLGLVFSGVTVVAGQPNIATPQLPGFIIYSSYLLMLFMLSFIVLRKKLSTAKGTVRIQLSYTYYGIMVASTLAMVTNVLLPLFVRKDLIWLGPPFTLIAIVSISLAIIRHRLFDIRAAVLRTLIYAIFLLSVSIVYISLVNIVSQTILKNASEEFKNIMNVAIVLVVAYSFFPIKRLFDRVTARYFFRSSYIAQDMINKVNSIIVNTNELEELLNSVARIISETLKLDFCDFYLEAKASIEFHVAGTKPKLFAESSWAEFEKSFDARQQKTYFIDDSIESDDGMRRMMRLLSVDGIIGMTANQQDVGYLIVGAKRNGDIFSTKDIQLLEIIADEVAIAVQNALRFEEISQFNTTLQKKIEDATAQLQKSNEKLKALDEAKDEFISMASHQLRTPLTSVKGYISMVLEGDAGEVNDQQKNFLDQAYLSSQRMVYLIADLLNVSRLKTGKFVIETKPTYMPDVVESEIAQLYETAKSRDLRLVFDKPDSFPTLNLDETKIRQVIMNFADNAIYYTPKGGRIVVSLKATNETIEYTVRDTGIGVPKSDQHRLFTKFYRAGNAKKARPDGTGLGLFMAKKVVVAQGGAIIFKTEEGKGSTFGFSFPRAKLEIAP